MPKLSQSLAFSMFFTLLCNSNREELIAVDLSPNDKIKSLFSKVYISVV